MKSRLIISGLTATALLLGACDCGHDQNPTTTTTANCTAFAAGTIDFSATPNSGLVNETYAVTWDAVTDADSYDVDLKLSGSTIDSTNVTGTTASFTISTVGTYVIVVTATHSGCSTEPTDTTDPFDVGTDPCAQFASGSVSISTQPMNGYLNAGVDITADWNDVIAADGYDVALISDPDGTPSTVDTQSYAASAWQRPDANFPAPGFYAVRVTPKKSGCTNGTPVQSDTFLLDDATCITFGSETFSFTSTVADDVAGSTFAVSWTAIPGVDSNYDVELIQDPATTATVAGTFSEPTTTYSSSIAAAGTYLYRVYANNSACLSRPVGDSNTFNVYDPACWAFGSASIGITAQPSPGTTADTFGLSWSAVSGASSYDIELVSDPFGTPAVVGTTNTTGTTFSRPITTPGTYQFRIVGNMAGCGLHPSQSSAAFTVTDVCTALASQVINFTTQPINGSPGTGFTVTWSPVSYADSYKVELVQDPSGANIVSTLTASTTATTWTETISTQDSYVFRITANHTGCPTGVTADSVQFVVSLIPIPDIQTQDITSSSPLAEPTTSKAFSVTFTEAVQNVVANSTVTINNGATISSITGGAITWTVNSGSLTPGKTYTITFTTGINSVATSTPMLTRAYNFTVSNAPPTFGGLTSADKDSITFSTNPKANTKIYLQWSAASDLSTAAGSIVYNIYRSTSATGENFSSPTATTVPGAVTFMDSGLNQDTTYYYVVRAADAQGLEDTNLVERSDTTMTLVGIRWDRFPTDTTPVCVKNAFCTFGFTSALPTGNWYRFDGATTQAWTGLSEARANTDRGGFPGLNSVASMIPSGAPPSSWTGTATTISVTAGEGDVCNTSCSGIGLCAFGCSGGDGTCGYLGGCSGGCYRTDVGWGGNGGGQVSQFNWVSNPYDIWTVAGVQYVTVYAMGKTLVTGNCVDVPVTQHYSR